MSNTDLCTALMHLIDRVRHQGILADQPIKAVDDVIYLLDDKVHDLLLEERNEQETEQ